MLVGASLPTMREMRYKLARRKKKKKRLYLLIGSVDVVTIRSKWEVWVMKFSISIHAHCSFALLVEQGANCGSNNLHSLIAFNATRRRQKRQKDIARRRA